MFPAGYFSGGFWPGGYFPHGGGGAGAPTGPYFAPGYFPPGFFPPGYFPGLTPATPLPTNAPLAYVQDRSFLDTCDLYRLVNDVDPTTHARKPLRYVPAATGVRCLMADKPVDDEATAAGGIRVFSRRIAPILTLAFGQEVGSGWRVKRTTAGKPVEWFQVLGAPSFSPFPGRPGFGDVRCEMQPDPHPLPVT